MVILTLFILGLCFGSFINALMWRVHEQGKKKKPAKQLSVLHGRSMCVHCRHRLAIADLIPVVSWVSLRGKCRYCSKPISKQYPVVELLTAVLFVALYALWPGDLSMWGQWLLLATWILASVGLIALAVYDIRWLLLPNRILYPSLGVALVGRLAYISFFADQPLDELWQLVLSILVASGFFWLLFMLSKGKWIGYGDVRLGLLTGTLLGDPLLSWFMIFAGSILGSLAILPQILQGKKSFSSHIPYGPFLIAGAFMALFFGSGIIDWYWSFINLDTPL